MRRFSAAAFLISLGLSTTIVSSQTLTAESDFTDLYKALSNPIPDVGMAAEVSDILLIRGGQEVYLTNGRLRLFKPVEGKIFGAVFTGDGTFTLYIPTASEREEFYRQTKLDLNEGRHEIPFVRAVFWFQEKLLEEMGTGLQYAAVDVSRAEDEIVERSRQYATDKTNENMVYNLITEFVEKEPQPFLFAHFFMADKKEIFLQYDRRRFEEVAVYRPPYEGITGSVWWLEMVNSFHLLEEYLSSGEYELSSEDKRRFDWRGNDIDLEIAKSGDVTGRAQIRVAPIVPTARLVSFLLDPELGVDSVVSMSGIRVPFHRQEEAWSGCILLPEVPAREETVIVYYHGEYLRLFRGTRKLAGMFYQPRSGYSMGWHPFNDELDRMDFQVRYTIPEEIGLVASGRIQSDSLVDGRHIFRYATTRPDFVASFTMGYFESEKYQLSDTEAVVTVYDVGTDDAERVGKDCANSVRLFTYLFGSSPFGELRVTGGPVLHGQAYQEFLHLPWFDEYVGEKSSAISLGRAHEVAHAWWGHGVGWASYHDKWLSEAFAEYSALLYAPFVLKKDEEFFEKLENWRERIVGARQYSLGSGAQLGSIWLGYRTSTSQTRGDYSLSIYKKGAWVLHMIRMMLFDLKTRNEDAFKAMMREFYQDNVGKDPSTKDFIDIVSKYFGSDMKWYFDQWVYGTEIPTLQCDDVVTKTPEGKYALKITITQTNVSTPFRLYLPFELRYRNGATARARLTVDKEVNEFQYELDREPEEVKYNILESVLCTIEK